MIKGVPIPRSPKSDDEIIEGLNDKIAKLRQYGVRTEAATEPCHVLSWSNAQEEWGAFHETIQPGETVRLDANEFLAPYRLDRLSRIVPRLDFLPLYKMSFEAKERGLHRVN